MTSCNLPQKVTSKASIFTANNKKGFFIQNFLLFVTKTPYPDYYTVRYRNTKISITDLTDFSVWLTLYCINWVSSLRHKS